MKLAIISSYDEGCGNASYSHALKLAFSEVVETDVLTLDLKLLQKRGSFVGAAADRHIDELANKLSAYDLVNIQFEAGLYGSRIKDILRRFVKLADAARNLIVTMHRIDPLESLPTPWPKRALKGLTSSKYRREARQDTYPQLYKDVIDYCNTLSKRKNVWICVHTKREARLVTGLYGMAKCFDYPLAFMLPEERKRILETSDRLSFIRKHNFPDGAKVVGVFGFYGAYKGFETAIRALELLPRDYFLGVFGGQHPQNISMNKEIDQHLAHLLGLISAKGPSANLRDPETLPLGDRVRFIGTLSDPDFLEALRCCDAVALPYLEVGQSMSGIFALATEMQSRLYCTSNHSFTETLRYYGDVAEIFDIGNFVQLAQKIRYGKRNFGESQERAYANYNVRGLVRTYFEHFHADLADRGAFERIP